MTTLKTAYDCWAASPKNLPLARKYREAVQLVLMRKYADTDLSKFTEDFVVELMSHSSAPYEFKTQAASLLIALLKWGAERGHCEMPTFGFDIARAQLPDAPADKESDATAKDCHVEQSAQHERGKRAVAQIDTTTHEVIKIWSGVNKAHMELKIQNIDRAIQRHGIAGGYYWCYEDDLPNFKPGTKKRGRKSPAPDNAITPSPLHHLTSSPLHLSSFTDEELFAELESRGWRGKLTKITEKTL